MAAPACDCRGPQPACVYLAAGQIWVGFRSPTTMAREESIMRLWCASMSRRASRALDRSGGSRQLTSCYEEYHLGEHYGRIQRRNETPSIRRRSGKSPAVYYSRNAPALAPMDGFPSLGRYLAMLRAYRAGGALPRVLGHVYLYPFRGWPIFSGPVLKGTRVTMSSSSSTLSAIADGEGNLSLANPPAGY